MQPPESGPPVRPDLDPSWVRPERRWLPVAGVLGVIVVVVLGGYVTAAALSESAGPPVEIPGVVQVRPLSGWAESSSGQIVLAMEGGDTNALLIQLTRGNGNFAVIAARVGSASPVDVARAFTLGELDRELDHPTVSEKLERVTLESGAEAVRFQFVGVSADSGVSVEGEVTVLVTSAGDAVIFAASAPEGLLQFILGDVHAMVDAAGFFE
jgi:hypothetical protein